MSAEAWRVQDVPEEFKRQQWAVYADTVRRLSAINGLSVAGLEQIRRDLRGGGVWSEATIPAGFEGQRLVLLNDVSAVLGELRGLTDYYRGVGDVLPEVPDTIGDLE